MIVKIMKVNKEKEGQEKGGFLVYLQDKFDTKFIVDEIWIDGKKLSMLEKSIVVCDYIAEVSYYPEDRSLAIHRISDYLTISKEE